MIPIPLAGLLLLGAPAGLSAQDRPVPAHCTAAVNAGLVQFVAAHSAPGTETQQDNVMVCGTTLRASYPQHAGHSGTGSHHVLVVTVPGQQGSLVVEVVTNDALDGQVSAKTGDLVFAYGQAYVDARPIHAGGFVAVAGIHDTHCSTHAGAENGWVVVNGRKFPSGSCQGAR